MSTKPDPKDYGLMVLSISREEIEAFDHIEMLRFLKMVKDDALRFEDKFNILVTGFDEDERELHEIKEVRDYFDFLDRCFPYWFFFLSRKIPPQYSPITMLIAILVPVISIISKDSKRQKLQTDMVKLEEFVNIHFHFLNELTDELELPIEENIRISKEILNLISAIFH